MEDSSILYHPATNSYQQLMFEAEQLAHFGGWEVNLITGEVKWSLKMYQILGFDPVTTKAAFGTFIRIVHKDDVLYIKKNLEKLLKFPSDEVYDFRIIDRKDGNLKYLRTGIVAKRDTNNRAISLTGFSHDITKQYLQKKRLKILTGNFKLFSTLLMMFFFQLILQVIN